MYIFSICIVWNITYRTQAVLVVICSSKHATYFVRKQLQRQNVCRHSNIIIEYCKEFRKLYGKEKLVINMHLACHLQQFVLDYGPINGFWCYGFERFNGIIGSFPNNNQNVAITMMKKFEDYLK